MGYTYFNFLCARVASHQPFDPLIHFRHFIRLLLLISLHINYPPPDVVPVPFLDERLNLMSSGGLGNVAVEEAEARNVETNKTLEMPTSTIHQHPPSTTRTSNILNSRF